ncbi:hypothetical protein F4778DRAFT_756813 [Xylariomycetidae sp. FL2044]|nr:hypothetical protein F4778DRAFT_756813 [Xylariomycetidae sp. FL2044]
MRIAHDSHPTVNPGPKLDTNMKDSTNLAADQIDNTAHDSRPMVNPGAELDTNVKESTSEADRMDNITHEFYPTVNPGPQLNTNMKESTNSAADQTNKMTTNKPGTGLIAYGKPAGEGTEQFGVVQMTAPTERVGTKVASPQEDIRKPMTGDQEHKTDVKKLELHKTDSLSTAPRRKVVL